MFLGCSNCVEHTAARAGSHNGGASRLADALRGLEVRKDLLQIYIHEVIGPVMRPCTEEDFRRLHHAFVRRSLAQALRR